MSAGTQILAPHLVLRDATPADHAALMALEGTAPHAGAVLIQARRNFFARTDAYIRSRVLVAEETGAIVGVLGVGLTTVRVAGEPCYAGYICNVRIAPHLQTRGLGRVMVSATLEWLETEGINYASCLIKTDNTASMKLASWVGYAQAARFDYLVLDLSRFEADPAARARRVDIWGDLERIAARCDRVQLHHFVPFFVHSEMFLPRPAGAYAGSWTARCADGSAWLSLWDDRVQRGLDPREVQAVKGYDLTVEGAGGLRAFSAIGAGLRAEGFRQLLIPLPHEDETRALLDPYVEELVEFGYWVKPLGGSPPLPPGPIYFDIRH